VSDQHNLVKTDKSYKMMGLQKLQIKEITNETGRTTGSEHAMMRSEKRNG